MNFQDISLIWSVFGSQMMWYIWQIAYPVRKHWINIRSTCFTMWLAQYNIDKVYEIAEKIVDICKEPQSFEVILQKLFTEYNLKMTFEQHVLVGSTVRSYLAWLKDQSRLDIVFEDNMLLWKENKY